MNPNPQRPEDRPGAQDQPQTQDLRQAVEDLRRLPKPDAIEQREPIEMPERGRD